MKRVMVLIEAIVLACLLVALTCFICLAMTILCDVPAMDYIGRVLGLGFGSLCMGLLLAMFLFESDF